MAGKRYSRLRPTWRDIGRVLGKRHGGVSDAELCEGDNFNNCYEIEDCSKTCLNINNFCEDRSKYSIFCYGENPSGRKFLI